MSVAAEVKRSRAKSPESNTRRKTHLAFVDSNQAARRSEIVRVVVGEEAKVADCEVVFSSHKNPEGLGALEDLDTVVVVIGDRELAGLTEGKYPRRCATALQEAFSLLDSCSNAGKDLDLYIVVKSDVSGVDVLSILLSGTAGVADLDGLAPLVSRAIVRHRLPVAERMAKRLLIGQPYVALDHFLEKHKHLSRELFEAAIALAEVPVDQLDLGDKATQTEAAAALDAWSHVTGYHDFGSTYRHIGSLAKCWDEQDEDGNRLHKTEKLRLLPNLPLYARRQGFPGRLIPIRGRRQQEITVDLYRGLREVRVRRYELEQGVEAGLADVPNLWPKYKLKNRSRGGGL